MLTEDVAVVRARAERLAAAVGGEVEETVARAGGGALPLAELPSFALRVAPITAKRGSGRALDALAAALRGLPIPVIGRIANGGLLLDLRCLASADDETAFRELFSRAAPP